MQPLHFASQTLSKVSPAKGCNAPPGSLVMILDNTGFNDSLGHGPPTLQFQRGQTVKILVCNLDSVQAHGFAIDHYFDRGITLSSGDAYTLSFVANETGSYTIYCNVFCTVHVYMQGKLVVS